MLLPILILLREKFLIPSTDYSDFEFLHLFICWWEQWWHIGESTRLPPIWSGFIALCGLSLVMVLSLVSRGFFFLVFPFSSNTSISEFQFDQEWQTNNHFLNLLLLNRYLFIYLFTYLLPCRLYQDGTKGGTIQAQPWGPTCCQS